MLDDIATEQIRHLNELTLAIRNTRDYRSALRELWRYVDANRVLLSTLLNGGAAPAMRAAWVSHSMKVAQVEGQGDSWLPMKLGTVYAATLIAETIAWWVAQPPGSQSIDEVDDILF